MNAPASDPQPHIPALPPLVLDADEAAAVLHVSPKRVRQLANSGALRRLAYSRVFLFSAAEIERFLGEQTRPLLKEVSP